MKIALISSPSEDGAGIVCFNMMRSLRRLGHDCSMLSLYSKSARDVYVPTRPKDSMFEKVRKKLLRKVRYRSEKYQFFDWDESRKTRYHDEMFTKIEADTDLLVLGFYQGFLNFSFLRDIGERMNIPVVLWMMDMVVFTGGCHYSWECSGYYTNCGNCPALRYSANNDISRQNYHFKSSYVDEFRPYAIAISEFQKRQCVNSGFIPADRVRKIFYGLDLSLFKAITVKKKNIREKVVFLFIAANINERRKGFHLLINALEKVCSSKNPSKQTVELRIIGAGDFTESSRLKGVIITRLGLISDRQEIVNHYQEATYTVVPTLMDSGPLTVMESLACGTPCISFKMGVASELVKDLHSGFLVERMNADDLAIALDRSMRITHDAYLSMTNHAREIAQVNYSSEVIDLELELFLNSVVKDNE